MRDDRIDHRLQPHSLFPESDLAVDDDRQRGWIASGLPQPAHELQPAHRGEGDVDDREIGALVLDRVQRAFRVRDGRDLVPEPGQICREQLAQAGVAVDHEDAPRRPRLLGHRIGDGPSEMFGVDRLDEVVGRAEADGNVPAEHLRRKETHETAIMMLTIDVLLGTGPTSHSEVPFDVTALRQRYSVQPALLDKLVIVLRQSIPKHMQKLRDALANDDADALHRTAHSIKGSIGTFMAKRAVDLATQLETVGQNGDLAAAGPIVSRLEEEVDRVLATLAAMSEPQVTLS